MLHIDTVLEPTGIPVTGSPSIIVFYRWPSIYIRFKIINGEPSISNQRVPYK